MVLPVRKGGNKKVTSPLERDDPDRYPSLIRYLEATGKVRQSTYSAMMKARNLYLRCVNTDKIAAELHIEPAIIDRWALCFSWDEERDRRMFEQFRKVNGAKKMFGEDLAKRHERIAGTIEQTTERLLQRQSDGQEKLSPRDLQTLASTIKATQEIRKTARGENAKKSTSDVNINVNVPGNLEKLAGALVDAYDRPKLTQVKTRTIAIGVEEAIGHDTEYESSSDRIAEERSSKKSED